MPDDAQQFLNDLDKKLWNAADRLRASLDAAVYKHAVLGLIFLKYVSDSSGSGVTLPSPRPLRTVHATFTAHGSSLEKAPRGTRWSTG